MLRPHQRSESYNRRQSSRSAPSLPPAMAALHSHPKLACLGSHLPGRRAVCWTLGDWPLSCLPSPGVPPRSRSRSAAPGERRRWKATHVGPLRPRPLGTWQTGFTGPRSSSGGGYRPNSRPPEEAGILAHPPSHSSRHFFSFLPATPQAAESEDPAQQLVGTGSSAVCETVQPKTQTPATDMF